MVWLNTFSVLLTGLLATVCCEPAQSKDPPASQIASFAVDVEVDDTLKRATVREKIVVQPGTNPESSWFFNAVPIGESTIENLVLETRTKPKPIRQFRISLAKNSNGLWQAKIPFSRFASTSAASEPTELNISYDVISDEQNLYVPLVYPPWKTIEPENDLFTATVAFPADCNWVESFPTQSTVGESKVDQKTRQFELSAVPSVLWLSLADQQQLTLGTGAMIDIAVLLVLAALGLTGWKYRRLLV